MRAPAANRVVTPAIVVLARAGRKGSNVVPKLGVCTDGVGWPAPEAGALERELEFVP
jgi:hypothetical protein